MDFTELIQETNELSKTLGISNEDALALTYSLSKTGFPPDQLDIITEYGSQLHNAGYNAQEIQGIMAAGVETGTWNIDVLLDGLKEGRIVMAEFGQGVDEATGALFEGIGVSGGDIVLRHDKKAEVRYQPSEFVLVFPDNPYPQCGLLTTSCLNENKEVIGNIYDNPELLKEAT